MSIWLSGQHPHVRPDHICQSCKQAKAQHSSSFQNEMLTVCKGVSLGSVKKSLHCPMDRREPKIFTI
ncbi:hypothetical protein EUGRSUZ_L03703 [Eucalyptus grandis]|uniref:Uncharacterized protein n=1 Tax=Eucalyptus grandis TaxID=71139 RepID=A0AAD9T7Z7_EUCGR|nr:hypothetical protein EUGRSUZ_L03703 [Eucalyptus grandis]